MPPTPPSVLDDHQVALLEGFVSVTAASRSADGRPSAGRGLGGRADLGTGRMTLFFPATTCAALLADVAATGVLAVVLSVPDSHHTLQLKARDATVEPPQPGDGARVAAYRARFARHLEPMGFPEVLVRALLACREEELRAVTFTPSEGYDQTPGPGAGARLGGRA